jgi:hypothetical protein
VMLAYRGTKQLGCLMRPLVVDTLFHQQFAKLGFLSAKVLNQCPCTRSSDSLTRVPVDFSVLL